jgi:mercuric ion transport protein
LITPEESPHAVYHQGQPRGATLREGQQCAADDPTTCGEVSKLSRILLWGSALIWTVGFFVAYLLGPILEQMDR